jgi:hypothetical protein
MLNKTKQKINRILEDGAFWGIIVALVFMLLWMHHESKAQSVTRQGNVFVQDSSKSNKIQKDHPLLTKYYYLASDGTKYPIYMSANGKCFIIRTSNKTGKQYKQYLPEVTKQLSHETRKI